MQTCPRPADQETLREKSLAWGAQSPYQPLQRPVSDPRPRRRSRRRWFLATVVLLVVVLSLGVGSLLGAIYWQARNDQTRKVDAIVVLGAAQYNGRPSPVLRARLEETLAAYTEGVAPLVVVTGGRMAGDQFTEAEASRNFLVDRGIPSDAILQEATSRSTWDSLRGAASLLQSRDARSVLLISDGFHLFRAKLMARELGLDPYGRPAQDSPIRPNSGLEFDYVIREAGGTLQFLWRHGL